MRVPKQDIAERFWVKVNKTDACWLWTASKNQSGYGQFCMGGKYGRPIVAHRVAWELTYGPIPDGLFICHACDVKACCNPQHLFLGSHQDNMHDAQIKQRFVQGDLHYTRVNPGKVRRGERATGAKLTEASVRAIRDRYAVGGITMKQLGAIHNVTAATIGRIVLRQLWQHVE